MSDTYKLIQKSVRHEECRTRTAWWLLNEHGVGYYVCQAKWTDGFIPGSSCKAFYYNGRTDDIDRMRIVEAVYDMGPQDSFDAICKRLGIKVRCL